MTESSPLPGMIEPELLVATCRADGQILSRNDAWIRILGEDDGIWDRLTESDQKIAEQNFREACQGSLVTHALFMAIRPDRDLPAPVLLHFIPVTSSSDRTSGGGGLVAITGEILAEPDSWTENQTDRHRMATLGRMTMGITHDFNNLLGGILGHITIMETDGVLARSPAELTEHISTIKKAANDGASLIEKIQRYIRQEKKAAFEPVNIATLIHDCVILTKPYWYNEPRRHGIQIEVQYDAPDHIAVLGSGPELRDVFVNLILNAVQAMPEGGQINISAETDNKNMHISFRDNGTGMTEDVRTRIFEPLFTTKTGRGTGMGLSVALGVIQEHDGSISVTSEWHKGTEFKIVLPLQLDFPVSVVKENDPAERTSASILLVDDEEMVRNMMSRLLTLRGHQVTSCESAAEALLQLEDKSFDVILSDQGMPGMNGREFAENVRGRFGNIPFVLVTGDTNIDVDTQLISRVVSKPFKIEELDFVIHELT